MQISFPNLSSALALVLMLAVFGGCTNEPASGPDQPSSASEDGDPAGDDSPAADDDDDVALDEADQPADEPRPADTFDPSDLSLGLPNAAADIDFGEGLQQAEVRYANGKLKRSFQYKPISGEEAAAVGENVIRHGEFVEYYPSGVKFFEGAYKQGRRAGRWTFYHDNDRVAKQGVYANGQPDGEWKFYNETGRLVREESYRAGKRHGRWAFYGESGDKPMRVEVWSNGQPDGQWVSRHAETGEEAMVAQFKNGKLHGKRIRKYPDGQLASEEHYKEGKRDGVWRAWNKQGELVTETAFKDGQRVSKEDGADL